MMPTAARFAASSAKPLARNFQSSGARVAVNLAGWGSFMSVFMGWPLLVQQYQLKVNCDKN